jgi:uncharacterized protein (DUF488 family)
MASAARKKEIEGKEAWNGTRSASGADAFTAGLSGRPVADLVDLLYHAGVRTVVDVRRNPVARFRPEVSRSNLAASVEGAGMVYVHAPQLGVPRDVRAKAVAAGRRVSVWIWYDAHVVGPALERGARAFLSDFQSPVVFVCMELDPHGCHRHRLALALEQEGLRTFDL